MTDQIYIVDPETKKPVELQPVLLSDIGIKERDQFQEWIIKNPEMLGEPFLIVTSEYNRFDKSKLRLDLLAIDKQGILTVIELKLDANRTLADLQAIRYAAFCSTMTIGDVLDEYANFHKCDQEEAERAICEFLSSDELPDLATQPRIVLAAGMIDDQELTSSVLWLRGCGVDISCVELTPYRNSKTNDIILVPKVLIPLPEAKEYLVSVERKEVQKTQKTRESAELKGVGPAIAQEFENLNTGFEVTSGRMRNRYMKVRLHHPWIHYEWLYLKTQRVLEIGLHFEGPDPNTNKELAEKINQHRDKITKGIKWEFQAGKWGKKSASARFLIPLEDGRITPEIAPEAAGLMKTLIERTWPIIEPFVKGSAH
jgi:hypothetical protein